MNSEEVKNMSQRRKPLGLWKGNHILIEFPLMVANARGRLQTNIPGCKATGTVARQTFTARKKNCSVELIVMNEISLDA